MWAWLLSRTLMSSNRKPSFADAVADHGDRVLEPAVDEDVPLGRRDQVRGDVRGADVIDVADHAEGRERPVHRPEGILDLPLRERPWRPPRGGCRAPVPRTDATARLAMRAKASTTIRFDRIVPVHARMTLPPTASLTNPSRSDDYTRDSVEVSDSGASGERPVHGETQEGEAEGTVEAQEGRGPRRADRRWRSSSMPTTKTNERRGGPATSKTRWMCRSGPVHRGAGDLSTGGRPGGRSPRPVVRERPLARDVRHHPMERAGLAVPLSQLKVVKADAETRGGGRGLALLGPDGLQLLKTAASETCRPRRRPA